MSEKIKIVKIGIKQNPSKYKPGETYSIVTVMDEQNRKLTAMGKWAEGWKVGDTIDAIVEEKKWTDRDGFEQTGLSLKNPTPSTFNKGYQKNTLVDAYHIAAALVPALYGTTKKVKMEEIDKLAEYVKNKLDANAPIATPAAPAKENVPVANVNETSAPANSTDPVVEDEDLEIEDDKPF